MASFGKHPGVVARRTVMKVSGDFSFHADTRTAIVEVIGAGGGADAHKGAAGGYASRFYDEAAVLALIAVGPVAVTVGVSALSSPGGTSTFDAVSATGGGGGTVANAAGGVGSGGDINLRALPCFTANYANPWESMAVGPYRAWVDDPTQPGPNQFNYDQAPGAGGHGSLIGGQNGCVIITEFI